MSGFWFARLGRRPKTPADYYAERRERRRRRLATGVFPATPSLIADRDNLYECYRECRREGGQSPGIDRVTYRALSNGEAGESLGRVSARLLDGTYRPQETRPVSIPKPGTDQRRELHVGVILDRVVAKALHKALEPVWEPIFLPCSYGFRRGRDAWQLLASLEAVMVAKGRWVMAVDDVKSAFDRVPVGEVLACHRRALEAVRLPKSTRKRRAAWGAEVERLLWLVETVLDRFWVPYGPLHERHVLCVREIRDELTRQDAEEWSIACAGFARQLDAERLTLVRGIWIVREWLRHVRRLLKAVEAEGFLPYPDGRFPTPTNKNPPPGTSASPVIPATGMDASFVEDIERMRVAIQGQPGGRTAKALGFIRSAQISTKRGRDALRWLADQGEYDGFSRGRPRRYREGRPNER